MASPWQILVGQFGVIADIPKIADTVAFFLILGIARVFFRSAGWADADDADGLLPPQ
jgi:hypothetical protein